MIRASLLALLLCATSGVTSASPAAPVAPMVAVADIHHGTATVTDTDIPGGTVLIGLSVEAYWGTDANGNDGIIFVNPETGGQVVIIDGGDIDVDISPDGTSATISNGASYISFSLS